MTKNAFLGFVLLGVVPACGVPLSFQPTEDRVADAGLSESAASSLTGAAPHDGPASLPSPERGAPVPPFVPWASAGVFADSFARANGPIGYGWSEKTADLFGIVAGVATLQTSTQSDTDDLILRSEAYADVEIEASYAIPASDPGGWGHVFARVGATSDQPGHLVGYAIRINVGFASIAHFYSPSPGVLAAGGISTVQITPELLVDHSYRLVLRVTGSSPVLLEAGVFDEAVRVASLRVEDSSAFRIAQGRVGFGGASAGGRWDDVAVRTAP